MESPSEHNQKSIAIIEPRGGGHHFKNVSIIAKAIQQRGYVADLFTTPEAMKSVEYRAFLERSSFCIHCVRIRGTSSRNKFIRQLANTVFSIVCLWISNASAVLIPTVDSCLYGLGFSASVLRYNRTRTRRVVGIVFQEGESFLGQNGLSHRIRGSALTVILRRGPFSTLLFMNDFVANRLVPLAAQTNTDVQKCPDPTDLPVIFSKEFARSHFGLPGESRVIGCVGVIDERKGVDKLIEAFRSAGSSPTDLFLFLAGRHSRKVLQTLENPTLKIATCEKRIISVNRFLEETEIHMAICASDVIAATYPNFVGSASILLKATAVNKPVIGTDSGWIGRVITEYGLGVTCNPLDPRSLSSALEWAASTRSFVPREAHRLYSRNTVRAFEDSVIAALIP